MAFELPDKGEGDHNIQSVMFGEYISVLVEGISGKNCVLSGCAVTGGADMTPAVAKGAVLSNGVLYAIAGADVTIGTADGTNPRLDLIVVTSAGALAVRAGTAAANPKPPARSSNDVVIGAVYVPASDTSIGASQITDLRVMRELGPICIYKQTTAETTNNTSSAIHMLNSAGSGLTIPNGLFLSGRVLRVKLWGNALINSGTPTLTLLVSYGGTTMFSDTSATTVADADRRVFAFEILISAQANNDQAMAIFGGVNDWSTAITAPTTGLGDFWGVAGSNETAQVGAGSAAVDSDTANRVLAVTWTFSVANAANELVVEGATVELL